ncbi:hypothetical protein KY285_027418 [Solanum tuberosum]|nr:hypothetical protein KY289_027619 [Solanum tuberosum]KAH0666212.1 hypothetical protein KY285_027418 [Solanum tuberosum]
MVCPKKLPFWRNQLRKIRGKGKENLTITKEHNSSEKKFEGETEVQIYNQNPGKSKVKIDLEHILDSTV